MPAIKVVYATLPNQVAKQSKCNDAHTLADKRRGELIPAKARVPNKARLRKVAVLCNRALVHSVVPASLSSSALPPPVVGEEVPERLRPVFDAAMVVALACAAGW